MLRLLLAASLLLGGLMISSCSQDSTPKMVRYQQHYDNATGEKGVTTYHYDADGVNTLAVWELLDGTRFSLNRYIYDSLGQLLHAHRGFSDGLQSDEAYTYDDEGRLIKETIVRSDGREGSAEYFFDKDGHPTDADLNNFKGWLTCRLIFTCDENGLKKTAEIRDSEGELAGSVEYAHDSLGNLTREHWDFNGRWYQTFEYTYQTRAVTPPDKYTSANIFLTGCERPVRSETYNFNGESGGPSHYTYDRNDMLTEKVFKRDDGLTTITKFLYDQQGRLLRSYRIYSGGEHGVFRYKYDEVDRLIERLFFKSDSTSGVEEYCYDNLGLLATGEITSFDGWLTGVLTFDFVDGRLESADFAAENGNDAKITVEHHPDGCPWRVVWTFQSGHTQTYTFDF